MRCLAVVLLFLSLTSPALASDGILEINQTCALNTGCFAGDAAGFPVTIDGTAGRSYRLTSDLAVPNENTDGIVVSTDDIGIDLNNFTIRGPVTCSGSPLTCTPASGFGSGVERVLLTNRSISVKNGSITGMGNYGVLLGEQAEVTNLRVRWNRIAGIGTSNGSTVSGNTAYQNGGYGIQVSSGSTVSGNTAFWNGSIGISAGVASTISGNTAYLNGSDGISPNSGSTVSGNTAYSNAGDGIQCTFGCIVKGNTARANNGFGINLSTDSAYSDNVVTGNTTGTVTGAGSGNGRGGNYCAGPGTVSANCP